MRIAILGTRGIPNNHGGFEQFAEFFSCFLARKGYDVTVFNSSSHPYQKSLWNGVNIVHCLDPEDKIGTIGQFIYDLNCIKHTRKVHYDVILQLGYTSSSVWGFLLPKKSIIVTNMDGLEWKRTKYHRLVRSFLKLAENWAVKSSDFLISDSIGIQEYILEKYNRSSEYIAYGAEVFNSPDESTLRAFDLVKEEYSMLIARLEPENNIETIIRGYISSDATFPLLIIGKINDFGKKLIEKYSQDKRLIFCGAIYDINVLNNLRFYSKYYFHGHSVGGTNPSLLEAMASGALIIAHDNLFNKSILRSNAFYFEKEDDITGLIDGDEPFEIKEKYKTKNFEIIEKEFNWDLINKAYERFLLSKINSK